MPKVVPKQEPTSKRNSLFEYVIILCTFFALRFAFKNILKFKDYFTQQPVFGLSDNLSIALGTAVLSFVVLLLALSFGQFLKNCEIDYEKPAILFVAFILACPGALPFLFDAQKISGTQLLYPFALFILTLFIANKPFVKWLVPVICAVYFIPAFLTEEVFFSALHRGSLLYVPLILLFLYLEAMKETVKTGKEKVSRDKQSLVLLAVAAIVSIGAYAYSYMRGYRWGDAFGFTNQKIDLYLLIGLLIVSPALITFGVALYKAVKNKFPKKVFDVFWRSQVLLIFLYRNNYSGLWVPFFILSLTMFVLYSLSVKNQAMVSAVKSVGDYMLDRKFVFFMVLIMMASLTNVSSSYLSSVVRSIFSTLPY